MDGALLDGHVAPFAPVDPAAVAAELASAWGMRDIGLTRLDTERDDTFRIDHADGTALVKVAHPLDDPGLLAAQDAALAAAAAAGLPVPVPQPTRDGRPWSLVEGRVARVLSWLPGDLAADAGFPLEEGGRMLGRLARALADVDHPAADRDLAWDLRTVPRLADATDDPMLRDGVARFAAEISPTLDVLPRRVIHNDFHPGNVLVAGGRVTGVLDFGDLVRTPRVCDLGVALGYLVPEEGSLAAVRETVVAGYTAEEPLEEREIALIPGLVVGRLLQRVIVNEALGRRDGGSHDSARIRRALARAREDWGW